MPEIEPANTPADAGSTTPHFGDLLHARINAMNAPLCVGLDPVMDRLPTSVRANHSDAQNALSGFSLGVVEAVADVVPMVKIQSACFERFGSVGVGVMEDVIERARDLGLLVLLDAKRADIGISMVHYAASAANLGAHAITASPYLGLKTLQTIVEHNLGLFVLVRTSNEEGDAIQLAKLEDGRSVCEMVADEVATLAAKHIATSGLSSIGAVVGATKGEQAAALRQRMNPCPILAPGFGAQGGSIKAVRALCRLGAASPGDLGMIVTASRSIIYPEKSSDDWRQSIREAAIDTLGRVREGLQLPT